MRNKIIVGLLAVTTVAGSLTGCMGLDSEETKIIPNQTMSSDTKWINSDIEGAIDSTLNVSPKDDFYTAVNKEWMLSTEVKDDEDGKYRTLSDSMDKTKDRLLHIVHQEQDPAADGNVELNQEDLAHNQEIVSKFAAAAGDWDQRNAEGTKPLEKYMQAIENIQTMDDMNAYLLNHDQQNLFSLGLIDSYVAQGIKDTDHYYMYVDRTIPLSLTYSGYYLGKRGMRGAALEENLTLMRNKYSYIMKKMGYSQKEIDQLLKKCYKFECRLVDHRGDDSYYTQDWYESDESGQTTSAQELEQLQGNYPLMTLLQDKGYNADQMIVQNPDYVKYIGSIYDESHLDEMKAYFMIQTVQNAMTLVDHDCYDKATNADDETETTETDDGGGDKQEQEINDDDDILLDTVKSYLSGPLDELYTSKYCKKEEKEDLTTLTQEIIEYYRNMLGNEDWMSDETKEKAVEKLDAMACHIMYPDSFQSYSYIDLDDDTELLDMVADINYQSRGEDADKIGQTVDRNAWNLNELSETDVNCYYVPEENSINILAGFVSGDVYSIDQSKEEKLAMLGAVIGHEITHGFDDNGSQYDKYGKLSDWWTLEDKSNFETKVANVQLYFNAIKPYPDCFIYDGSLVSGEAIADMGGMKCMLEIAKDQDNFDYQKFFESYEILWGEQTTYDQEVNQADYDEHPVDCLRGNVTVQQFDEFYQTFDIQKGDGMYLAPEERIAIW